MSISPSTKNVKLDRSEYTDIPNKTQNISKIEVEIEELQEDYNDISQDTLEESFEVLKENVATSQNAALNENYTNINENYKQYWTDNRLRFIKNDNGTYLIEQQDENGIWIAMGYTTEEIALEYLRKIKSLEETSQEEQKQEEPSQPEEETQQVIKNSDTMFKEDLPDNIKQEYEEYLNNCIKDGAIKYGPNGQKHPSYDGLSEMTKKIIDGDIKIVEKQIADYIELREDYTVPKGKTLVNTGGFRNVTEGETIKWNPETGKYHLYENGVYTNVKYDIEEIKNATLK